MFDTQEFDFSSRVTAEVRTALRTIVDHPIFGDIRAAQPLGIEGNGSQAGMLDHARNVVSEFH